jgi:hypothetical protein
MRNVEQQENPIYDYFVMRRILRYRFTTTSNNIFALHTILSGCPVLKYLARNLEVISTLTEVTASACSAHSTSYSDRCTLWFSSIASRKYHDSTLK